MSTFLKASRRHDGEIDGTAQVDQVCVGLILDLQLLVLFVVLVFAAADIRCILVVVIAFIGFSKNLGSELLVGLLVGFPIRVKLENIETVVDLDLVIKTGIVGNLIFLFDKIQLFLDSGVVLVAVLSNLE